MQGLLKSPCLPVQDGLADGKVRKIAICILDAESKVHERYVVSVSVSCLCLK